MDNIHLQYISQGSTPKEHLQNIQKVCEAGGKWIQLRLKNVATSVYLETAMLCREICNTHNATLLINDNISVAKKSHADGVHLGLNDTSPKEARTFLGDDTFIGGTANTLEDCKNQARAGVDYIGLGPFRFTTTKKKLSPILGLEGYTAIVSEFRKSGFKTPIIAIGGITELDIKDIVQTGVSGIAVSGTLTQKENLAQKITQIHGYIKNS